MYAGANMGHPSTAVGALEADQGKYLGYVRLVGRRQGSVKLADHIENVATQYTEMPLLRSRQ
jgi:hypothetical protein